MKYIIWNEINHDVFTKEFNTKEEAIKQAHYDWNKMATSDKKRSSSFFVLESVNPDEEAENHYDGDIILTFGYQKYRIVLTQYTEGSGRNYSETIDNVDNANFDLIEYLKDYFSRMVVNDNEWYDALLIDNDTDETIKEVFDVVETINK